MSLSGPLALMLAGATPGFSPQALFELWPERRVVEAPAPCLRHADLAALLQALAARHPGSLALESVGRSVEGREIQLLTLGRGPRRVMLWSQMHGDEPSATPALLDVVSTLLSIDAPEHRLILERLTLLVVPMLNPDGAARYTRRNSQAIDINRDALHLATPEGRLLKDLRDRFQPELAFNLHDQNRRTTVGETGVLASIALLAVSGDAQGTLTPGRARAKRVCSKLARTLAPFVPGGIARYDEDWNPRAFGDNITAWGTPVVLIESGAVPTRPLLRLPDAPQLRRALERAPRPRAGRPRGRGRRDLRGTRPKHGRPLRRRAARGRPHPPASGRRAVPRRRGLRRARRRSGARLVSRPRRSRALAHP